MIRFFISIPVFHSLLSLRRYFISWARFVLALFWSYHSYYNDVIMGAMASQITSVWTVYSIGSGVNQRKHQSSAFLAFVRGIHRSPVNSPHKAPVTRKMFPFDDVIMARGKWVKSTNTELKQNTPKYKPDTLYLQIIFINGVKQYYGCCTKLQMYFAIQYG